ncbi:hypothetical protein Hanom_Chr08g00751831 [Helianthus anomalus]
MDWPLHVTLNKLFVSVVFLSSGQNCFRYDRHSSRVDPREAVHYFKHIPC